MEEAVEQPGALYAQQNPVENESESLYTDDTFWAADFWQ
jgi:hypothetical protein